MRRAELTFDAVDDLVGAYARGRAGLSQPSVSFSPSTLGPLIELAFQSSDGKHGPLLASPWLDRLTQSDSRSALARGQNIWFDGLRRRGFLRGLREAIIRALLYVGTGRAAVDERGFEALRRIRRAHGDIPLSAFKALVREQFYLLLIDTEAALAALPSMLPADADTRRKAYELIKQVMIACGPLSDEDNKRMQRVAGAFGLDEAAITVPNLTVISSGSTGAGESI